MSVILGHASVAFTLDTYAHVLDDHKQAGMALMEELFSIPEPAGMDAYVYDEHFDCIICPEYQILNYSTTNRDGYRECKSDPKVCANCPTRHLCTKNKDCIKTVTRHIWKEYEEMADDARYTPIHRRMYKARKETIERVFADAKEKHGMRYTRYTGLAQVTNWVKLGFAAMNLKKFANWHWKDTHSSYISCMISFIFPHYEVNPCFA